MGTKYCCDQLNAIHKHRVSSIDHAARIFAHRLAAKVFGRGGRMLGLQRIRRGSGWAQYQVRLGRRNGPSIEDLLLVEER